MTDKNQEPLHVLIAMDFSDVIIEQLSAVSSRIQIDQYPPDDVPDTAWRNAEVIYTQSILPQPLQAPRLRWIQLHSAGVEHVLNQDIVRAEDVIVTSASGIHATQIAQFCWMMILAFHYKLLHMMTFQHNREWPPNPVKTFLPPDLASQTLGIVGYGSIGRELARQAEHIGMPVLASKNNLRQIAELDQYRPANIGDPQGDIPDRIYPAEAIVDMARECDYLVVATPYTEKAHHLINEDVFDAMPRSSVLVNVARGSVVDEAALISALAAKHIRGAALDVFETEPLSKNSPLWGLDNVIISPHVAGYAANLHQKAADLFAKNLQRYVENRPLLNRVDRKLGY